MESIDRQHAKFDAKSEDGKTYLQVAIVFALIMILFGLKYEFRAIKELKTLVKTDATIVSITKLAGGNYDTKVEYFVKGEQCIASLNTYSITDTAGKHIQIAYDPLKPTNAVVAGPRRYINDGMVGIIGLCILLFNCSIYFKTYTHPKLKARKKPKRIKQDKAPPWES